MEPTVSSPNSSPIESDSRFPVRRSGVYLRPDNSRMLLRPFVPGNDQRLRSIIQRILRLSATKAESELHDIKRHFSRNYDNIDDIFSKRCQQLRHLLPQDLEPSPLQILLIGAYFMSEYSLQSAALFNPSVVPHPDQSGLAPGSLRFIMSLRATGEGHISSIEFREGVISIDGHITFTPASSSVTMPEIRYPHCRKADFMTTLCERGFDEQYIATVFSTLSEDFTNTELEDILRYPERWACPSGVSAYDCQHEQQAVIAAVQWATHCDYLASFPPSLALSDRVLFPVSAREQNGIEDARFVHFCEDDGSQRYYATYTAYDGDRILPQIIATEDFLTLRLRPLHGAAARNKGMALFPRRIGGRYAMLGRQDGENITLMFSNDIDHWNDYQVLLQPEAPWEYIQIGNCGSPLETSAGWLVLMHGVGAMRNYCIGAALLDLEDPRQVIGRLSQPLLEPLDHERDGYVPNVVYSCGSLIHNGQLILPYAVSDYATTYALVELKPLLEQLSSQG